MGNSSKEINQNIQVLAESVINNGYNTQSREFNTLVTILLPRIKGYMGSLVYDMEEVDDLTSITFLSICKHLKTYKPDYMFVTWSYSIARNVARDFKKTKAKGVEMISTDSSDDEPSSEFRTSGTSWNSVFGSCVGTTFDLSDAEMRDITDKEKIDNIGELYSVLMNFEESIDKDIFIHKEINRILIKDISEYYGISENTVKTKNYNFRRKLKNAIYSNHKSLSDVLYV